jgi:hypothetical protein
MQRPRKRREGRQCTGTHTLCRSIPDPVPVYAGATTWRRGSADAQVFREACKGGIAAVRVCSSDVRFMTRG